MFLLIWASSLYAKQVMGESSQIKELGYLKSDNSLQDAREVLTMDFEALESTNLNFQPFSGEIWIKIKTQNLTKNSFLLLDNAQLDSIDFYQYDDGILVNSFRTGDHYLYKTRGFPHPKFIFSIAPTGKASTTLLVRIKSLDLLNVPVKIETGSDLVVWLNNGNMLRGLYYGIILVMFLYHLILAFLVRTRSYFSYSLMILFLGLAQFTLEGDFFVYFSPNSPFVYNHGLVLFSALAGVFGLVFTMDFLRVKEFAPRWMSGLCAIMMAYILGGLIDFLGFKSISLQILNVSGLLIGVYTILVSSKIYRQGYRPALFYLIGWSILQVALILFILKNINVIPSSLLLNSSLRLGSAAQAILLSIALADRINILRKEKELSQEEALRALEKNEKLIRDQNETLEAQVDLRTAELQESNEELNVTLANLRDTQSQLVDAEKMASLGQLTAGIAHEINNPINFVTSNIKPLKRDLGEVYEIIDKYQGAEGEEALKEARELAKELEYEYLKDEISSLVDGISDGAKRTSEIVAGLRTFSRLDEDVVKMADIHENLDSTLVLLRSKMKDAGEVEKIYDLSLPEIECFPGKLNQVFMNILNNAIYAVKNKNYPEGEAPTITVETKSRGELLDIYLRDNGIGMDEATQRKMFDPFFTTKDVGEGTGLGMSIVYKIIEKHSGSLKVKSKLGEGTEFKLTLPMSQPKEFE